MLLCCKCVLSPCVTHAPNSVKVFSRGFKQIANIKNVVHLLNIQFTCIKMKVRTKMNPIYSCDCLFCTSSYRSDLIPVRMKNGLEKRFRWYKAWILNWFPGYLVSFNRQTHSDKNTPRKADVAEAFRNQKQILKKSIFIFAKGITNESIEKPLRQVLVDARRSLETYESK